MAKQLNQPKRPEGALPDGFFARCREMEEQAVRSNLEGCLRIISTLYEEAADCWSKEDPASALEKIHQIHGGLMWEALALEAVAREKLAARLERSGFRIIDSVRSQLIDLHGRSAGVLTAEIGPLLSGQGYSARLVFADREYPGQDHWNLLPALEKAAHVLLRTYPGSKIPFAGLSPDFYETGLTANSGSR